MRFPMSPPVLLGTWLLMLGSSIPCTSNAVIGRGDSPLFNLETVITFFDDSPIFSLETHAGVGVTNNRPPSPRIHVAPCQPNPFNPATTIRYQLGAPAFVDLAVFDVRGRRVRTIRNGAPEDSGWHEATWNGRDETGRRVAGGVYYCRLRASGESAATTMTLVK